MTDGQTHHTDALLETAKLELDRAHRAAVAMEAGDIRRGLELSSAALEEAELAPESRDKLRRALADLDSGKLSEMASLIEAVRSELGA